MKKTVSKISFVMAVCLMATAFAGCGKGGQIKKSKRILYSGEKLSTYVDLGEYKEIPVDTGSDTFKTYYDDEANSDVKDKSLYDELSSGKVQNGDIANIDYCGKKDGVAFDGGTAEGSDLEIGSNSFIPGFESGLIGVSVGETVDLDLTFPENYQSEELAGKAVVFTVKVNSIKRAMAPKDSYSKMGFKTFNSYDNDLKKRAARKYLLEAVSKNSKTKSYPDSTFKYLSDAEFETVKKGIKNYYGVEFDQFLQYNNMDEATYRKNFEESQIKPMMDQQMVIYGIADKEGISYTETELDTYINDYVKKLGNDQVTKDVVIDYYGKHYFENELMTERVCDFLYNNAKIK